MGLLGAVATGIFFLLLASRSLLLTLGFLLPATCYLLPLLAPRSLLLATSSGGTTRVRWGPHGWRLGRCWSFRKFRPLLTE